MTEKSRQKFKNLENEKSFKLKESIFMIFKGLSLKQIKQFFWENESPTLIIEVKLGGNP